jgi:transposase
MLSQMGRVLTRGDRRRNERLARLRSIVRRDFAVLAVDLASVKQATALTDHDSRVLGRRMFTGNAWVIDDILDWAEPIAAKAVRRCGSGVRADRAPLEATAVLSPCSWGGTALREPMLLHRGREEEDFTRDRSDFKDDTIIAKRVAELRCYVPCVLEGHWCRLRHLGTRRADHVVAAGAARQRLRDLLECEGLLIIGRPG